MTMHCLWYRYPGLRFRQQLHYDTECVLTKTSYKTLEKDNFISVLFPAFILLLIKFAPKMCWTECRRKLISLADLGWDQSGHDPSASHTQWPICHIPL